MDKCIYDENNGLWYELQGDYYLPCLTLPAEEKKPIGIWGQRHKRYLKKHRKATYTTLLISGKLNTYLAEIDKQAQERYERLIEQMKQSQGVMLCRLLTFYAVLSIIKSNDVKQLI